MGTSLIPKPGSKPGSKQEPKQGRQSAPIVEFIGLPGAGKTTLCTEVARQLHNGGRSVVRRDEILQRWHQNSMGQKLMQLWPDCSRDWQVLTQILALAAQVQPLNTTSVLKAATTYVNAKRNTRTASHLPQTRLLDGGGLQEATLLLDQGVLQEAWSVAISGQNPPLKPLQSAIEALAGDGTMRVVALTVDVETALDRIHNRPTHNSRFDAMNPDRAGDILSASVASLQTILDVLRALGVPILEVDSSHPIEENGRAIAQWIFAGKPQF